MTRRHRVFLLTAFLSIATWPGNGQVRKPAASAASVPAAALRLPLKANSVRVAIIGDSGTGKKAQYDVSKQMMRFREAVGFDTVLMLGDNIYGGQSAADFKKKFEDPYQPLLAAGVKFYASLGNHDNPNGRHYKAFNMGGQRYYSFKSGEAEFFALDSNYMDPVQVEWIQRRLSESTAIWKICFFHHPLYSSGKRHGSDLDLRKLLQPMFEKYGVNLVLAGHEHFYERFKPQNGVEHFILGNSGQLRVGNIRKSPNTVKGFDRDVGFGLMEITEASIFFQIVTRTGVTVDSGAIERRATPITQ
jgi:hypothetical protein